MDALHAPIGRPPAEGIVRLRLPSPTVKQSTGLFALISAVKAGISASHLLRFACAGNFALCGARRGLCPSTPPPLRKVSEPF